MHCYNTRQSVNLDLPSVKQPPLNALFNFAQSTYGILLSANTRNSQSSAGFKRNVNVNYVPNYKSNFDFF